MNRILLACILIALTWTAPSFAKQSEDKPAVDVVFCIDCSGSMGGVIETAKQKVWAIVNEMAKAKPAPVLRIGLIGYGNGEGPFRTFALTDDLDEVYKNLMTFRDEGWGDEFVGLAIHRATDEMKWSEGKQVLRVMFIVGNETARQGPAAFETMGLPAPSWFVASSAAGTHHPRRRRRAFAPRASARGAFVCLAEISGTARAPRHRTAPNSLSCLGNLVSPAGFEPATY